MNTWPNVAPPEEAVTVIVAEPLLPSLVAVIVSVQAATTVTRPLVFTEAIEVLLLDQLTARPVRMLPPASFSVAVAWSVAPTSTLADARLTVTDATGASVTVMVAEPLCPPARRRDRRRTRRHARHQAARAHRGDRGVAARPAHRPARQDVAGRVLQRRRGLVRPPYHHARRRETHRHRRHGHRRDRDGRRAALALARRRDRRRPGRHPRHQTARVHGGDRGVAARPAHRPARQDVAGRVLERRRALVRSSHHYAGRREAHRHR